MVRGGVAAVYCLNIQSKRFVALMNKIAASMMILFAPKAVSKILSDTADGENFGTNGRNYQNTIDIFLSCRNECCLSKNHLHTARILLSKMTFMSLC